MLKIWSCLDFQFRIFKHIACSRHQNGRLVSVGCLGDRPSGYCSIERFSLSLRLRMKHLGFHTIYWCLMILAWPAGRLQVDSPTNQIGPKSGGSEGWGLIRGNLGGSEGIRRFSAHTTLLRSLAYHRPQISLQTAIMATIKGGSDSDEGMPELNFSHSSKISRENNRSKWY